MEKQIPSGIPQIASLPTSHESRNIGLSLPKQVNFKKQFTCIVNVAAVQHVPHEVEAMHSDSRASAELRGYPAAKKQKQTQKQTQNDVSVYNLVHTHGANYGNNKT